MHGSSAVPQQLLQEIRCYGGNIRETYGVPVVEIQEAIRHGVRKINIDTDIRLAMTVAMRRTMKKNSWEFDPRKFLQAAMDETKKVCIERFEAFGAAGRAAHIRPIDLEVMAALPRRSATTSRALRWTREDELSADGIRRVRKSIRRGGRTELFRLQAGGPGFKRLVRLGSEPTSRGMKIHSTVTLRTTGQSDFLATSSATRENPISSVATAKNQPRENGLTDPKGP